MGERAVELFIFWLIMAGVVAIIASSKGFSGFGWFLYGFVIWPIALVHVLVRAKATPPTAIPVVITEGVVARSANAAPAAPAAMKTCPMCAEQVQAAARICRFCRHEFVAAAPATVAPSRTRSCPACMHLNAADASRCTRCGVAFPPKN